MGKQVIENAWITLNGIDVSNRVKKVTIMTSKRAPRLVTTMGQNWEENIGVNIRAFKLNLDCLQDYSTGSIYAAMKAMHDSTVSSGFPVIIRPTTDARTTGNPEWQGSVLMDGDFGLIDASVGEENVLNPSFMGNGTLSFLTSSS